jgi:hypothetical protein
MTDHGNARQPEDLTRLFVERANSEDEPARERRSSAGNLTAAGCAYLTSPGSPQ